MVSDKWSPLLHAHILTTHLDESWTRHFKLGLTKFFLFQILTIVGQIFHKCNTVFWTHQIEFL